MAAPDYDVIKDIPGYKVILKAVLKSQIQQLVSENIDKIFKMGELFDFIHVYKREKLIINFVGHSSNNEIQIYPGRLCKTKVDFYVLSRFYGRFFRSN